MITIRMAGLNISIDNRFVHGSRFAGFETAQRPDFTVSVTNAELDAERRFNREPDEYLEFVCIYRKIAEMLADYDAFVFHSAVVARGDGPAFLFTAPSGTGKTTHIRLWCAQFPDCSVLNGDKPIIRYTDGQFLACGTPWNGKEKLGSAESRPLHAICMLHRGTENHIRRATQAETAQFVMKQVYLPRDPARLAKQLALMNSCFTRIPMYTMYCNTEPEAARMAWEAMSADAPR